MELQEDIDDLKIAEKNWNKVVEKAKTMGYREGIMDGKEAVYQQNFETGFEQGFQNGKFLGMKQGISLGHKLFGEPNEHHKIVENKDMCSICKDNDLMNRPISEVIKNQNKHFQEIVEVLNRNNVEGQT